eukprot:SAG31_NODE_2211_length_6179_cov_2.919572_5_plen_117_part_00
MDRNDVKYLSRYVQDIVRAGSKERISFSHKVLERTRQALCYGLYIRSAKLNRNGGYFTLGEQRALVLIHPSSAVFPAGSDCEDDAQRKRPTWRFLLPQCITFKSDLLLNRGQSSLI